MKLLWIFYWIVKALILIPFTLIFLVIYGFLFLPNMLGKVIGKTLSKEWYKMADEIRNAE